MIKITVSDEQVVKNKDNALKLTKKYSMLDCLQIVKCSSINDIANYVNSGHIVIPATFKRNKKNDNGNYTRCIANFDSLQTLFLDIDNKEEVTILDELGNPLRDDKGKIKKEIINYKYTDKKHISVERAKEVLKELGLDYFMIYTTLSHTDKQHKFRVCFLLDEIVTDINKVKKIYKSLAYKLSEKSIEVDAKALEPTRLFYGGNVIEVKENSYLDLSKLEENTTKSKNKEKVTKTLKVKPTAKEKNNKKDKDIEDIKKAIIDYINDYINANVTEKLDIDFTNMYNELSELIDLTEIFSVEEYEKFSCCFHSDTDPSAYIYYDKNNNNVTTYHCFGCDVRLNAVQLMKKIFEFNNEREFIKYLEQNTKLSIGSAYQKNCLELTALTVSYILRDDGFKKHNETVYKYLDRRNLLNILDSLYQLASINATITPLGNYSEGITFFSSISYFTNFHNKRFKTNFNYEKIRNKINALANLGLIKKLDIEELSENVKANCKSWMKRNKCTKYPNFYYLIGINTKMLDNAERIIKLEKKAGVKVKNQCKKQATIIQENKADSIYVQNKKEYNIEEESLFIETVKYISSLDKKYFEICEIVNNIDKKRKFKKAYKEKQVEIYLTKLVLDEVVKKVKCSKANKEKYNISSEYTHYQSVYVII